MAAVRQDQLIGYLLGALDADQVAWVEQLLASDGEARRQLDILRRGLAPLEGSCTELDVPPNLAGRTCQFIWESAQPS